MSKVSFPGPLRHTITCYMRLSAISIATALRHAVGRKMAPDWGVMMEIGIRYWRRQHADFMRNPNKPDARKRFYSVQTETDDIYDVTTTPATDIPGLWFHPAQRRSKATLLYFHGGGYGLRGHISHRFAAMLAHHTGAPVLCPHYRLTPEHPHPAQSEDALAAWHALTAHTPPENIVVIGDSAGGHMALMLLQSLRGRPQPALCIALCPWTDIGDRGASMTTNNATDMVQGWMAVEFGQWLDPQGTYGREALSPIFHDYKDTAPIYMQAGGREVLHDMIVEFADVQKANGADIQLDVWDDMPHDFQLYDTMHASSTKALEKIANAVNTAVPTTHSAKATDR